MGFIQKGESLDDSKFYRSKVKESLLWPDGVVPFTYAEGFPRKLKDRVVRAMSYFNQETNIRFTDFNEAQDEDAIVFTFKPKLPCSSFVGRVGGLQQVFLNFDCLDQSIIHELMHALGFVHEQQLPYRDRYLNILWENIKKDALHNFVEAPEVWVQHYLSIGGIATEFDYKSIMIYNDRVFARPGAKSMKSTTDNLISPTQRGLSEIDLERLDALY